MEDIRKKAQDLLKTRRGVPGEDSLQQQLQELGKDNSGVVGVFLCRMHRWVIDVLW